MTISAGVVGPSHWAYMAKEFEQSVGKMVILKRTEPNLISHSLYADAKEFFQLLSQSIRDDIPGNPPASANAYMIASRAIRTVSSPGTRESPKKSIEDYLSFFERIQESRELDNEQLKVATSLQRFLHQLYIDGQSERYESRVKFKERLTRN